MDSQKTTVLIKLKVSESKRGRHDSGCVWPKDYRFSNVATRALHRGARVLGNAHVYD